MNTLQLVAITYTSHEDYDWTPGKGEERITSIVIDDPAALVALLKLADDAPLTLNEALYMNPTANALARLICALEELHGRHFLGSDQILKITEAER
jgi:hypothetical protein